jgi:hypothetical protein
MRFAQVTLMASLFFFIPATAFAAEEVTVADLVEMGAEFAGWEVSVEGELVGDYGFRGDGWMWTQLNGDAYVHQPTREGGTAAGANTGIAVRMPHPLGKGLDPPGGYRHRGPVVAVTGIWKHHDPQRQGESYLEVESLTVVAPGHTLTQDVNWWATVTGLLLVGTAAGTWLLGRTKNDK